MMGAWSKAYTMRLIKRPALWIVLGFVIIMTAFLSGASKSEMSGMPSGIFCASIDDGYMSSVADKLTDMNGILAFRVFDDEEDMIRAVQRGELRFAYAFDTDITERMNEGNTRRIIKRYSNKDDIFAPLADEVVLSKLIEEYAPMLTANFIMKYDVIENEYREKVKASALQKYDEYMESLGTVFIYETGSGQVISETGGSAAFPVRGFISVLVLICAMYGAQMVMRDEERALLHRLSPANRNAVRIMGCALPSILMTLALLLCVGVSGMFVSLTIELLSAVLLICMSTAFCFFVSSFMRDPDSIAMLMPIIVLLTIALCPIFFDLTALLPQVRYASMLLPSYWYLASASGSASAMLYALLYTAAAFSLGFAVRTIKKA